MSEHELTDVQVAQLRHRWWGTRVEGEVDRFRVKFLGTHGREPTAAEYYAAGEHGALAAAGLLSTEDE